MIRDGDYQTIGELSWPRTSGDDPIVTLLLYPVIALAPHERG